MKHSLFGTDGVRGAVGKWPFVPEAMCRLGFGIGQSSKGTVVVGRDTRASGSWIQSSLQAGITASGKNVLDLGVVPTAVVARVAQTMNRGLGVVISASHNSASDNGIKVLRPDGRKATEGLERRLENALGSDIAVKSQAGQVFDGSKDVLEDTRLVLKQFKSLDLCGLKVALDTAHGAAFEMIPQVVRELNGKVSVIGDQPNGLNINKGCGSTHLKRLQAHVVQKKCALGFAFDGDADRCLAVDGKGHILDGDALIAILATSLKVRSASQKIVGTVMTNGGLEQYLKSKGLKLLRTPVGDKYVSAKIKSSKALLGGENSGHLIIPKYSSIGDGLVSMLAVLKALQTTNFDVGQALKGYESWPQILLNVQVSSKPDFYSVRAIKQGAVEAEKSLKGRGRLLLRYSGTESLARVMVEGQDPHHIKTVAGRLATIIKDCIGV